ncbi:MAG: hypothetical protein QXZ70_06740 [Candidatus Bathyarchaeia archaeon]
MPASKDYQEKIDVLDIIISILKDHEESLSKIADRFDALSSSISEFEEKASILDRIIEHLGGNKIKNIVSAIGTKGHLVTVNCKSWQAFKGASQGSLLLAYEIIDDMIMLSSVTDLFIFSFSSELSEISLFTNFSNNAIKRWIDKSREFSNGKTLSDNDNEGISLGSEVSYKTVVNTTTIKRWLSTEMGIPEEKIVEGRVIH